MSEVHAQPKPGAAPAQADYAEWARQLVEGLVEAERRWLELAAAQNELTFNAIRQGVEALRNAPTAGLSEWARQGLENLLEIQRSWTGNFNQQRMQFLNSQLQPGSNMAANLNMPPTGQMAGLLTQPVEMLADARRGWLEFAASQNAQVVEGVKRALDIKEGTPAATYIGWTQDAVNSYVEFQKRWLDLLTQLPFQAPGAANKSPYGN